MLRTSQLLQLQVSQDSDASALDEYAIQVPYPHALLLSQFSNIVAVVRLCCFVILKVSLTVLTHAWLLTSPTSQ